jgi:hypothetical protein
MTNQGKVFKVAAICAVVGPVLFIIMMFALGKVTGPAGNILSTLAVVLMAGAVVATLIALGVYKEQGRKPGSTPLIYAVIAFPAGIILLFTLVALQLTPLAMVGLAGIITSVPALIIGLVKKLSVKSAPAAAPAFTE